MKIKRSISSGILFLIVAFIVSGFSWEKENTVAELYSVRMAESEMLRFQEPWMTEYATYAKWNYHIGVYTKAMMDMCEYTGDMKYFDYVEPYYDMMIDDSANITRYKMEVFNIDHVNPGKDLFALYRQTGKKKYRMAADTLRKQMAQHPRTSEGGFWHKMRYPWQMWLDGLYMGSPFLAQYAKEFNEPALFDDVANQVILMAKHTYDPAAGLFYHAWDESREQSWADKETGRSRHFWGRGMGWFAMAQVDILDYMPEDHPQRPQLLEIVKKTADGIVKCQDPKSGVWYQVLDQGDREGNYLESSASAMFVYFLFKAIRKGYLDESYLTAAEKGYHGILETFIQENEDGTITLTSTCCGAGLGGDPYRDGSFEYYITEEICENDPKGTGPFIWASMEYERHKGVSPDLTERQLAFPGAEGFGAYAKGGRGGKVIYVTNLNDSGPGSLRAAVEDTVPRMVLFKVSGTIELKSDLVISSPYITIAGQTAPGDGICLKNYLLKVKRTHNVVVRFLRVRPGIAGGQPDDAINIDHSRYVIIDHCSASWSTDEVLNTWHGSHDITIQWCLISEPLNNSIHRPGHGYAASIGGNRASYHHNLFANAAGRNPSLSAGYEGFGQVFDFSNNVVFNWQGRTCDGKPEMVNFVGNYYKPGPATQEDRKRRLVQIEDASRYGYSSKWYISENVIEGHPDILQDNWSNGVVFDDGTSMNKNRSYTPFENGGYVVRDADEIYEEVLDHVGAVLPTRDIIDERIIRDVRTGETTYGDGMIDRVDQTKGWPELKSSPALADSDNDGMPDEWEKLSGLNPLNPADGNQDRNGDGYTNLEDYLNELAKE
jgi:unsaturated rhamnogalacturonyl hydrolase